MPASILPAALAILLGAAPPDAALEAGLGGVPPGPARALWASGLLLGAPYRLSPLGEGMGQDPDPRFRLDAFDCVTLVETAVALGHARTLAEARVLLDDIRYHGPPAFERRNHYLEAQWLPANREKGWIEDVTEAVAGDLALRAEKRLTPGTWRAAERAGATLPGLPPSARPLGTFPLPLLPLDHLLEVAPRIPPGTLLLVVREDRPWRPYRVTHLGLVVEGPRGERRLRHASDLPSAMRVRDEPLARLAARGARYRWPVVGVSLWAVRDNRARAAALLANAGEARPAAGP